MTTIRARIEPERVADIEAAAHKTFTALGEAQPDGVRYASSRVAGTDAFVVLLQLDDGVESPLPAIAAFRDFQDELRDSFAGAPTVEQLDVVGAYRLF